MKRLILLIAVVFLVSCGIDKKPYTYPDEGAEAKGNFATYEAEGVSFPYPEKWKVYDDTAIPGKHYTFTIIHKPSGASMIDLSARISESREEAENIALDKNKEINDNIVIENMIKKDMEDIGYKSFFVSNVVQEEIKTDKKTIYTTKAVAELDPDRVLISHYYWAEKNFFCSMRLMSFERDFKKDNPYAKKIAENFKLQ